MKVRYNIENLAEKINSELTKNEQGYFSGFTILPDKLNLTYNEVYTVLGIEYTSEGFVNFMISDDTGVSYPKFYPSEFFEVTDNRISKFWLYKNSETYPFKEIDYPCLVTFPEAVNDEFFFDDLLECKNDSSEVYEKYKNLMENEFPNSELYFAEIVDNSWLMCPHCDAVWEIDNDQGIISCPKNGHKSNNPFWNKN